jgi:hypothetical protein
LEEAATLHQESQKKMEEKKKSIGEWGAGAVYDSKFSHSIVAGLRDAYRRIFEEGYFGRTIHDVVSYYNNDPDKAKRGDDLQKQNDKGVEKFYNRGNDNGIGM